MAKKITDVAEIKADDSAVKTAMEGVAKKAKKAAESKAAKTVKATAKKTAKTVEKVAEKTVETTAKVAKKAAAKVAKTTVLVQFAGREVNMEEVLAAAKKDYAENNTAALKELTLYIKPEDGAAYYVANGEVTGKVAL